MDAMTLMTSDSSSVPSTGLDNFLRASLARENASPAPPDSMQEEDVRRKSAQADIAARYERSLASLTREHRGEIARLEARLAAAEHAARELAGHLQELR